MPRLPAMPRHSCSFPTLSISGTELRSHDGPVSLDPEGLNAAVRFNRWLCG
jgi:hypothetical protein